LINGRFDLAYQLVIEGAFNANTELDDPEKVRRILSKIAADSSIKGRDSREVSIEELQGNIEEVIRGFVENGILTSEIVSDVKRHFGLEDITTNTSGIHFHTMFYSQTEGFNTRDTLFFPSVSSTDALEKALHEEGVDLDQQTVEKIRIKEDLGHECGHAVVAAFVRRRISSLVSAKQSERDEKIEQYEIERIVKQAENQVYQELYFQFPLQHTQLHRVFQEIGEQSIFDPKLTSIERIPMSLEFAALTIALHEEGLKSEKIALVVDRIKKDFIEGQEDFPTLYEACCNRGYDLNRVGMALPLLKFIAKGDEKLEQFVARLVTGTMTASEIGYDFALTEDQLATFVSSYEDNQ
jgi:hypothetical protein